MSVVAHVNSILLVLRADSQRGIAARGTLWTAAGFGGTMTIRLGSNLILTRLLTPEAFGLMSLVVAFSVALACFTDMGVSQALIQHRRGDDPIFLDTAWTIQIVRGFVIAVMCCVVAWPLATFYAEPKLLMMIPITGMAVLTSGFTSTATYLAVRHLKVAKLTVMQISAQVISAVVMIAVVWNFRTVWALVWSNVFSALVLVIAGYFIFPGHSHRFSWNREAVSQLSHFGKWIFISTILTFFTIQSDRLLVGKLLGTEMLGIFGIALLLATMPGQLLQAIDARILFPTYSRIFRDSPERLPDLILRARAPLVLLGGGISASLIASGPALVSGLYDSRYAEAGWMLQIIALSSLFQQLEITKRTALVAIGRTRDQAIANASKVLAMCILVPIGYKLDQTRGILFGIVASDVVIYLVTSFLCRRQRLAGLRYDLAMVALTIAFAGFGITALWGIDQWSITVPHLVRAMFAAGIAGLPMLLLAVYRWRSARAVASE